MFQAEHLMKQAIFYNFLPDYLEHQILIIQVKFILFYC